MTQQNSSTQKLHLDDQVKITRVTHPWHGAIGRLVGLFNNSPEHWIIELETISPGHRAMAHQDEVRRV